MGDYKDTRYNKKLARSLAHQGAVNEGDLETAMQTASRQELSLDSVLLAESKATDETLLEAAATDSGLTPVDLRRYRPTADALRLLSADQASHYRVLPLAATAQTLTLAVSNPYDVLAFDDIQMMTGLTVYPVIATTTRILEAISSHYAKNTPSTAVCEALSGGFRSEALPEVAWPPLQEADEELGAYLRDHRKVSQTALRQAQEAPLNGASLAERLVHMDMLSENDLAETLVTWRGTALVDPTLHECDAHAMATIPAIAVRRYGMIPLDRCRDILTVASARYLNSIILGTMELITECRIRTLVCTVSATEGFLRRLEPGNGGTAS